MNCPLCGNIQATSYRCESCGELLPGNDPITALRVIMQDVDVESAAMGRGLNSAPVVDDDVEVEATGEDWDYLLGDDDEVQS